MDLFINGELMWGIFWVFWLLEKLELFGLGNDKLVFFVMGVYVMESCILKDVYLKFFIFDLVLGIIFLVIGF